MNKQQLHHLSLFLNFFFHLNSCIILVGGIYFIKFTWVFGLDIGGDIHLSYPGFMMICFTIAGQLKGMIESNNWSISFFNDTSFKVFFLLPSHVVKRMLRILWS